MSTTTIGRSAGGTNFCTDKSRTKDAIHWSQRLYWTFYVFETRARPCQYLALKDRSSESSFFTCLDGKAQGYALAFLVRVIKDLDVTG